MALSIDYLEVKDFRNYEWFLLELDRELTILQGPNAAGKTNLIEALQLLTTGESFRSPKWDDVVREGTDHTRASITASGDDRELSVVMDVQRGRGRTYRVNGKTQRSVSAASGIVPCVLFTPEDLGIAKGSSQARRNPLDLLGSQISATYDGLRREYQRILRQRNTALKENQGVGVIETLTEQLIPIGARLMTHRRSLLGRLSEHARETFAEITGGEELGLRYAASWEREGLIAEGDDPEDILSASLQNVAARERARGSSIIGPHRDDIEIEIDGRSARRFGSQGQQRAVALAWKLAEVAVIEDVGPQRPILLLDDVMSELDEQRRHALADRVKGYVQTVMTTTNLHYFDSDLLRDGRVVSLGG